MGEKVNSVAWLGSNNLGTGSSDGARIWDVEQRTARILPQTTGQMINSVAFNPDGRFAAAGQGRSYIFDHAGHLEHVLDEGHDKPVWSVAFAAKNTGAIATGSGDHRARIWNRVGQLLHTLPHDADVYCVAFASDGRLATASKDKFVRVFTDAGELLYVLPAHTEETNAVAFGDDGQLASASDDGDVIVWPNPSRWEQILAVADRCHLQAVPLQRHGSHDRLPADRVTPHQPSAVEPPIEL